MRSRSVAVLCAALVLLPASAAAAETIGGEQLAAPGVQVNYGPGAQPLPKVSARSWLLGELGSNAVLASKNAHEQRPPASTLKTLTALTLIPQLDVNATYVGKPKDGTVDGSRVGIVSGASYTVNDLFHALFLPSANDAAVALAHANGGVRKTVSEMNAEAQRIGALDTVAKGPSGLDARGQVSSAYDLALIAKNGLRLPYFAELTTTKTYDFPMGKSTLKIYNQNRLLQHNYKGIIGVKTGYTTNAGRTFVAAATRNGVTLVVSLLDINEWSEFAAKKLLDWGFENHAKVTPVGTLVDPASTERPAIAEDATVPAGEEPVQAASSTSVSPSGSLSPLLLGTIAAVVLLVVVVSALVLRSRRHHAQVRGAHAARRQAARTSRTGDEA